MKKIILILIGIAMTYMDNYVHAQCVVFNYTNTCAGDANTIPYPGPPQPVAGTFSISPTGMGVTIDSLTGELTINNLACGEGNETFTIEFRTNDGNCAAADGIAITTQACPISDNTEAFICTDGSNLTGPLEAICPDCPVGSGLGGNGRAPADVTWWDAPTGGNLLTTGNTFDPTSSMSALEPGEYAFYVECGCASCPSERLPVMYNVYAIPTLSLNQINCRVDEDGDYDAVLTVDLGTWNSILDGQESTYSIVSSYGTPLTPTISSNGTIVIEDIPVATNVDIEIVVAPENRSCLASFAVEAPICCPQSVDDFSGLEDQCIDATVAPSLPSFTDIMNTIDQTDNAIITWVDVTTGLTYTNPEMPPAPIYTEDGCKPQIFPYQLHIYCATDANVDLYGGNYKLTVWPIPAVVEETEACQASIIHTCNSVLNTYVLYDNDGDGNYTDVTPPVLIPDVPVDISYIAGYTDAPTGCALVDTYTTGCTCDLAVLEIPISQGNNGGVGPVYYNEAQIDIYGGTPPYTYAWDVLGYVRFARVNSDDSAIYPNGDIELEVIWADNAYYSVTVTDVFGCEVIATNDPGISPAGEQEVLDITDHRLEEDNCLTRNLGEGKITIDVSYGTPPYEYEWSGPSTWASTVQYYGAGSATSWLDIDGWQGEIFELTDLPYGWYAVTVTDSGIDDYNDRGLFDVDGNPIIDDDPGTPLPEQKTEAWYWIECGRQGGRGKVDIDEARVKAYPNPFDAITTIDFSSPVAGKAQINLFTPNGQQVLQIFNGMVSANESYNVQFEAGPLTAGLYLLQLNAPDGSIVYEKLILSE